MCVDVVRLLRELNHQEKLDVCLAADGEKANEIKRQVERIQAMQTQLDDARAVRIL